MYFLQMAKKKPREWLAGSVVSLIIHDYIHFVSIFYHRNTIFYYAVVFQFLWGLCIKRTQLSEIRSTNGVIRERKD